MANSGRRLYSHYGGIQELNIGDRGNDIISAEMVWECKHV